VFDVRTVAGRTARLQRIDSQSLGLSILGEITREKEQEALHLGTPSWWGVLDGCDETREFILHRLCRDVAGGGIEVEVRNSSDAMGTD
jgi:hypothetical protein